jgi:hypothetical protein
MEEATLIVSRDAQYQWSTFPLYPLPALYGEAAASTTTSDACVDIPQVHQGT